MKVCSSCQRCYDDAVVSCSESEHSELSEVRQGSPDMVAGYRLDMMLDSGLRDETYRASRIDSDQPCLIKIVSTNEEYKQQFISDARTAITLFNQSICDVYEAGSLENGDVFVVAEEPAGQTVRELLHTVGVPQLLTTIQVMRQAAEAVHALHLGGLIHRAVRPENIVLTTDVEHRLLVRIQNPDLGGVVEHSIVSDKFLIDSALDSLRYFAPEQFSDGATIKTDVYGLGIVLYEMLSGAPPFDADKASGLIDMHRNQRPADIQIDNFDLRMLLTHTLMESLQKEPAKRQSSANAFARQLRHMEQLAMHSPTPPPASVGPAVPSPPPPTNVVAAGTAAAARRAPVIETPRAVNGNETPPVKVKAEPELVIAAIPKPAAELKKAEPELALPAIPKPDMELTMLDPELTFRIPEEVDIVPSPDLETAVEQADNQADLVLEQPTAATKKAHSEPAKSRLKRLKKQLRSFTTSAVAVASAEPPTPPVNESVQELLSMTSASITPAIIELEQPVDDMSTPDGIPPPDETLEARSTELPPQKVPAVIAALATVAAAADTRKIEWEPEDDLPSLDDIPEALFYEPMPAVVPEPHVIAQAAPVSSVPRKIEWEQPENDIPSLGQANDVDPEQPPQELPVALSASASVMTATVSNAPRKIEWTQPEDDVPSIEETFEVLARGQMPVAPPIEPPAVRPESAPTTPRKIEWLQPEDDIPSMEDISGVLLAEQVPAAPIINEPQIIASSVPSSAVPRKIEWEQPEDDVPSMEDISGVLLAEQGPAAPIIHQPQIIASSVPASAVPRKIEWEEPEDDIPSMEDVLQVLSEEPKIEAAFVAPAVDNIAPTPPITMPRKIECRQSEDDIPSMEDALEVLAKEDTTPVSVVEPEPEVVSVAGSYNEPLANLDVIPAAEPEPAVIAADVVQLVEPAGEILTENLISAIEPEPEEITLVSPPRRIQIDWEQPKPWETLSSEIEFFPTLLGDVDTRRKADTESERFFSDYYAEAEPGASDHYRSLMIGSGFIVLIVLFLFGNDSVWKYIQGGSAADSVAVQTTSPKQTFPQSGQTNTPNEQGLLKNFEKPEPDDDVESSPSKPSPIKVGALTSDGTVNTPADKASDQKKEPQPKVSQRSSGKTPLVPSTLVISSDDGKISSKVEPQKRKSTEPTRPRIVENPNP